MISLPKELETFFRKSGIEVTESREIPYATQYFLVRGLEKANLTFYRTGKVVVGGKPDSGLRKMLENRLPPRTADGSRAPARPVMDSTPRLGIDEAGKGDYFGPLVVSGVRITGREAAEELYQIGVRDSKSLNEEQVVRFAGRILGAIGPENVSVVSLPPSEFEHRRAAAGNNVNRLLGEIDAEIIGELKGGVKTVIVDEYAKSARASLAPFVPEGVLLEVRSRAEDDAAVAAASILARARYLQDMKQLSERVGLNLPKGATHVVEAGRRVARERGEEGLKEVAKVSFATTEQVLGKSRRDGGR